ncbi:MAG: hypothetical protein AAF639_34865 [Chloroflexota bacterium]
MAVLLYPSSYRCDCGHECDFSEGTVNEMSKMSQKKKVRLEDDDDKHTIIFYRGKATEILCPTLGTCKIDGEEY